MLFFYFYNMICEHLQPLEKELIAKDIKETFRGQPWTKNCREWVYYDCFLDTEKIKLRLQLPEFITAHQNNDPVSGLEEGLVCNACFDAIIGHHHLLKNKIQAEIVE